jgi:hypothetical protein
MPAYRQIASACAALATVHSLPVHAQAARLPAALDAGTLDAHVREAARTFGLPETWIHAVIRQESRGRPNAVSRAGAMGLMQLMPRTWQRQRTRYALGQDPFDPRNNILAGTSYLREMYDAFGMPGCLAAYNAGPARFLQWRNQGRPLPAETRSYVAAIAATIGHAVGPIVQAQGIMATMSWTQSQLFPGMSSGQTLHDGNFAQGPEGASDSLGSKGPDRLFADIIHDQFP